MDRQERIQKSVEAKLSDGFQVYLRKPLALTIHQMHAVSGGNLTLEAFIAELLEGLAAEFRLVKFTKDPPDPPLLSKAKHTPLVHARGGPKPFFSAKDITTMRVMRAAGEKTKSIAMRFRVSSMTIRRYLRGARAAN